MKQGEAPMAVDSEMQLPVGVSDTLSRAQREPSWLREQRRAACELFNGLPLPRWERTDATRFPLALARQVQVFGADGEAVSLPAPVAALWEAREEQGGLALLSNGPAPRCYLRPDLAAKGVYLADLPTAAREREELVRGALATAVRPEEGKFEALNTAAWTAGVFLYVPPGVEVEAPLRIHTFTGDSSRPLLDRVLVVADRGSRVSLIEESSSPVEGGEALRVGLVEIVVREDARVFFASVQNLGSAVRNYVARRGVTQRAAYLEWVVAEMGSGYGKTELATELAGTGSESDSTMVFLASGEQHLDVGCRMIHVGQHTRGEMDTKGVVKDRAYAVYRGMTDIRLGAVGTNGGQRANTLILNEGARADSIPGLEIDENDVSAGHAATTGQVDRELLFYMQSRGIPLSRAKKMIVDGFFAPAIERIPLAAVRDQIQRLVDAKMAEERAPAAG